MSLFGPKHHYTMESRTYLKNLMLQYLSTNAKEEDIVVPIFSSANEMIKSIPERKFAKAIRQEGLNSESAALNILQNHAMMNINQKSLKDYMFGSMVGEDEENNAAYRLYKYVNELKYSKGYITKMQYEENNSLADELSSPYGRHIL